MRHSDDETTTKSIGGDNGVQGNHGKREVRSAVKK